MSTNVRTKNGGARRAILQYVRNRAASGEPCAICGRPIDVDAPQWFIDPGDGKRKRAPWSLECDEIVPVSKGGSPYDPANVQPAHRICNQRAGDKRPRKATAVRQVARVDGETTANW